MASFGSGVYVEPGAYSKFKPTTEFPVIPGGLRVPAILGKGSLYNNVVGETVVTTALQDTLAHTAATLSSILNAGNFYSYSATTDFTLSIGGVYWLNTNAAPVGSVGVAVTTGTYSITAGNQMLYFTIVDTDTWPITVTFTAGLSTNTAVNVCSWVDTALGTHGNCAVFTDSSVSYMAISASAGANTSIQIGDGTANNTFGFPAGQEYVGSVNPISGDTIQVSYSYAKVSADYVPTYYFSLVDVVSAYGDPTAANTLALGAQIAFENGAQVVLGCQLDPADVSDLLGFRNALDKIETKNCNIVTVMTDDANLYPYVEAHVDQMSSILERKERTAIIVASSTALASIEAQALGLGNKRIMLVYPTSVRRVLDSGVETSIGGCYLTTAISGIRCNPIYDVAEPLTRKELVGFSEITDNLLRAQKNELAANGVCIVETDESGVARVRHAITTDISTANNQEYTVTDITDYTGQVTRQVLERMYVGTKLLSETPVMVAVSTKVVLQNLVDRDIITEFSNLSASQNTTDPRQIDVRFAIKPVYTLNWIYIEFSIATQ